MIDARDLSRHDERMSLQALFIEALQSAVDLPVPLHEHAPDVTGLEEHRFDASYIVFLDEQIRLGVRGPEWTERLKRRRAALLPFCDATLVRGRVQAGNTDFSVEIAPDTRAVVHWEEYEDDVKP